jgi:hypothetical protein
MQYVLSRTVALAYQHSLPFIPLHYTYVTLTFLTTLFLPLPNFNTLHFTSLHFLIISTKPSLHLIYHFPNITWFAGESP